MDFGYKKHKTTPLTDEEIKSRCVESKDELNEVYEWKKEEEEKLNNPSSTPQRKGAAKRALKKVARRIDTVKGQIIYWEKRIAGESHFRSNLAKNEFWAECTRNNEAEKQKETEKAMPDILKKRK